VCVRREFRLLQYSVSNLTTSTSNDDKVGKLEAANFVTSAYQEYTVLNISGRKLDTDFKIILIKLLYHRPHNSVNRNPVLQVLLLYQLKYAVNKQWKL
jgi:hypothetical protein